MAHDEYEAHGHGHDDGAVHAHISSVKFYVGILGALMFFTLLTVAVASIHLGPLNLAVAVIIASIKATLVVMFFMHLRHDNKFHSTILICSLMFIGVFFAYTMNDTSTRADVDDAQGAIMQPSTGQQAPGGAKGVQSYERSHENVGGLTAPGVGEEEGQGGGAGEAQEGQEAHPGAGEAPAAGEKEMHH
jgi:cytochrome c oxidase subunit 4